MAWLMPRPPSSGQVIQEAGPVFVRFDEGGHRLLDRVVVAAGILAVRAKDIELVLQVVSETGSGQIKQVAHIAVAGDKAQGLAFSAAGDQDRRVRVLQGIGRIERPEQLVVRSLPWRLVSAPHLQDDLHHLFEPLEPFGQGRERYAQP